MTQISFFSFLRDTRKKPTLRCENFLSEMNHVIPWKMLEDLIEPYYYKGITGRPPFSLLLMLKIYCLQQWNNLADKAMEEAIYDRNSFQKFLEIDLSKVGAPDETTILNFRHLLEENQLQHKILVKVNEYLQSKGLMLQKGTIVDATLIHSPHSTRNKDRKRDPEMSSTKKNGKWHFGMKAHIGVDSHSGLVHTVVGSTAKRDDRKCLSSLLHGKEEIIIGDRGYDGEKLKRTARQNGIVWAVADRKKPKHTIHKRKTLSNKQKRRNRQISSVRSKVEHPFRVLKCLWGHSKTRYRGICKNVNQFKMLFALYNLHKVRKNPVFSQS